MSVLEVGQVLSLRIRFNNAGDISQKRHPYLIMDIDEELIMKAMKLTKTNKYIWQKQN